MGRKEKGRDEGRECGEQSETEWEGGRGESAGAWREGDRERDGQTDTEMRRIQEALDGHVTEQRVSDWSSDPSWLPAVADVQGDPGSSLCSLDTGACTRLQ